MGGLQGYEGSPNAKEEELMEEHSVNEEVNCCEEVRPLRRSPESFGHPLT